MTFGVPMFHVYMVMVHFARYTWSVSVQTMFLLLFQLMYSPRAISGLGLTDGEAMERLWAYLHRFSKCTKEMRPSYLIDILTSALSHYGFRVRLNLGKLRPQFLALPGIAWIVKSSLCEWLKHA